MKSRHLQLLLAVLGVCVLSSAGLSRAGELLSEGQLPSVVDLIQELKSNPLRPEENFRITRLVTSTPVKLYIFFKAKECFCWKQSLSLSGTAPCF